MEEIEKRKEAIALWLSGKKNEEISVSIEKSRQWVHKWIKRFKANPDSEWFCSQSNAPKTVKSKVSMNEEQQIIHFRKALSGEKYAQTGAISIQYEFYRFGLEPPPVWTINRVLARNNLIQHPNDKPSKGTAYPKLFYTSHQMDIVGPRYLKGGFRFYSLNLIDVETHNAMVYPVLGKCADLLIEGIIAFWQEFGFPGCLQMDNELAFRGSNRYPRSLGLILRFILSHGVVPLFIPVAEPWRNGIIEKFNDTFNSKFLKPQRFENFEQLKNEAPNFSTFHNQNHRYSTQNNRTPKEMLNHVMSPVKLSKDYILPDTIPLEGGLIKFIRFIRSDLKIVILSTSFLVKKELMYSYVEADLIIDIHTLLIKQGDVIHHKFYFPMPVDW